MNSLLSLNDKALLVSMIPLHRVAMYQSERVIQNHPSDMVGEIARDMIRRMRSELHVMQGYAEGLGTMSSAGNSHLYLDTVQDYYVRITHYPLPDIKYFEIPQSRGPMNEFDYLTFMIQHHLIGINMCRKHMQYTDNVSIMALCNQIKQDQTHEVVKMRGQLPRNDRIQSKL